MNYELRVVRAVRKVFLPLSSGFYKKEVVKLTRTTLNS
jgi:hypothetical protein